MSKWITVENSAQVLAVHAALLPVGAGQILYFAGDQWNQARLWQAIDTEPHFLYDPNYLAAKAEIDHSRIYDCATQQILNPGSPDSDLFCCGHALLPNGALLAAGGTQHWHEDVPNDPHAGHWSGSRDSWLYDPFLDVHGFAGATVTAAWAPYQPNHLDLFLIRDDGTVWTTWWEAGRGWQPWFFISGSFTAMPGTAVTAVWANYQPYHLDLFAIASDGTVWSTWWNVATRVWQPWFQIGNVTTGPGSSVSALWASYNPDDHLDLFVTDARGTVWSTWWNYADGWQPWFSIGGAVPMAAGAPITAVWAPYKPPHLDLFATDPSGTVWTTWWNLSQQVWQPWFSIGNVKAGPKSSVAARWAPYNPDHIDLFVTDAVGTVWSTWWNVATRVWQPWFPIRPGQAMASGAAVTALWAPYNPDHIDLFVTDEAGTVWSTWWNYADGWQPWFSIGGATLVAGAPITALWAPYHPTHLDIFATDTGGTTWTTWWEAGPSWQPWFSITSASGWIEGPTLNVDPTQGSGGGRWYTTLITLPSGSVLAMCGHPIISDDTYRPPGQQPLPINFDDRHNNTKPEIFDLSSNAWALINRALGVSGAHDYAPFFPRMHVVPFTGEVLIVQPLYSSTVISPWNATLQQYNQNPNLWTLNEPDVSPNYSANVIDSSMFYNVASQDVPRAFMGPQARDRMYVNPIYATQWTSSVMLPLLHEENYHARVMICGATQPLIADLAPTGSGPLQWAPTAPRKLMDTAGPPPRYYVNSTLLPTGDVLVSGGTLVQDYVDSQGVKTAEIYHPPYQTVSTDDPDSWENAASASQARGYHSVALLMPDGRVWTAGSEANYSGNQPNLVIELFEPDYYSQADRPEITSAPKQIGYGQELAIGFASRGAPIARVVFMRCGSVTHGFDGDQRYVSVPFTESGSALSAVAPPDATIAPPGYYKLWLIDENNLPCVLAPFVHLGSVPRRK